MSNDFKVGLIEQDGDGYWDIEFGRVYEVTATPEANFMFHDGVLLGVVGDDFERVRAGGQP